MKYRLLALDIDGTLLNSESKLTDRTKGAIVEAQARGIQVVLATGRRLTNTLNLVKELELTAPVVVHNGAVIYEPVQNEILFQRGIELALALDLVDKLEQQGINYIVYMGESGGERVVAPVGSWNEPEDLLSLYLGERVEFVESVTLTASPIRISIIDETSRVDRFFTGFQRQYGGSLTALSFRTKRNIWLGIELLPLGCSKGTGLAQVAEKLGITAAEVIAIGDNINDLEMIAWAGMGVAMENGSSQLKDKAARIAPSHDQEGVAQIIEELLL